jgi:hypothetical protein
MAEAKDCPKCGLVNPPSAQRCDCGYDFVSRTTERSYLGAGAVANQSSPSFIEFAVCVFLPGIGLLLGLVARIRGRRVAGRLMLLISGIVIAVCNAPIVLVALAKSFKGLGN